MIAGLLERVDRQQRQPDQQPDDLLAKRKDLTFGNGDPNSTLASSSPVTTSLPKTISPLTT